MLRILGWLWALPVSVVGELVAAVFRCTPIETVGGPWDDPIEYVARGKGVLAWWFRQRDFGAFTFGDVIIYRDLEQLGSPTLRAHERRHVEQYRRLGPFFFVVYRLCSLLAWVMGRDAYRQNWLEMDAQLAANEVGQ